MSLEKITINEQQLNSLAVWILDTLYGAKAHSEDDWTMITKCLKMWPFFRVTP